MLYRWLRYKTRNVAWIREREEEIFSLFCSCRRLENKVVFDNFFGRCPGDDPKYIALRLREAYPDIRIVWLVNHRWMELPTGFEKAYYGSREADYHLRTAKVWVDNVKNAYKPPKRKHQYYIQTWHGIMGMKSVEAEVPELSAEYVKAAQEDAAKTDLMYANNQHQLNLYKHSFWYGGEVIKCDVPKLSVVLSPPSSLQRKVRDYYHFDDKKKIALYAPTFRDSADVNCVCWNFDKAIRCLEQRFGGEFVLLIRLHPNHYYLDGEIRYGEHVVSATAYEDIQELLAVSDVLINDYSSTMFEFGLTGKPVFLICQDYREYTKERPLKFSFEELPYPVAFSDEQLCDNIMAFDRQDYERKLDGFHKDVGLEDHGRGACIIADLIARRCHEMRW